MRENSSYEGLLSLSRSKNLHDGNPPEFIKESLIRLASDLEIARASFWLWNEKKAQIENEFMYKLQEESFCGGDILEQNNCQVVL